MVNVSGYGVLIQLVASNTFPQGITLSQFSEDADPLDITALEIAEAAMGPNGDLIAWARANPIEIAVHVLPRTKDDVNLQNLLEANRVGAHKVGARDVITLVVTYPDGYSKSYTNGVMIDGDPGAPVAGTGRMKTKGYKFKFENTAATGSGAGV